jgi:hypothetical protein
MNDATLALAGVCLGLGSAVGWAACIWWRDRAPTTQRALVRRVYRHVDDLLGATKTENQIRAGKRFAVKRPIWRGGLGRQLGRAWADTWWPVPQLGTGTAALPSTKRMAAYVQLEVRATRSWWVRLRRPYGTWDIVAVTCWWTSESNAMTEGFAANVGRKVAQAMRLDSLDRLEWDINWDLGRIRYARRGPAPEMPTQPPAAVGAVP